MQRKLEADLKASLGWQQLKKWASHKFSVHPLFRLSALFHSTTFVLQTLHRWSYKAGVRPTIKYFCVVLDMNTPSTGPTIFWEAGNYHRLLFRKKIDTKPESKYVKEEFEHRFGSKV